MSQASWQKMASIMSSEPSGVTCPTCGAAPGRMCETMSGKPTKHPHDARARAWIERGCSGGCVGGKIVMITTGGGRRKTAVPICMAWLVHDLERAGHAVVSADCGGGNQGMVRLIGNDLISVKEARRRAARKKYHQGR